MATTEQVRDRYWLCRARGECLFCRAKVESINPRTGELYVHCDQHRANVAATLRANGKHKRLIEQQRKARQRLGKAS